MTSYLLDMIAGDSFRAGKAKQPLLVMVHGYGADMYDLFGLEKFLPKDIHIVSLEAPIHLQFGGKAWYDIDFHPDGIKTFDTDQALRSKDLISDTLKKTAAEAHVDKDRIFLLGFSQGAILSYSVVLDNPGLIRGAACCSGYVNPDFTDKPLPSPSEKQTSFFISHGTFDEVIPVGEYHRTLSLLANERTQAHEYPVGHGIGMDCVEDMNRWLAAELGA